MKKILIFLFTILCSCNQKGDISNYDNKAPLFSLPNTNNEIINFTNGVYDLDSNVFREGRPDDYITLCTNNDYIDYCDDDENIEEINMFMSQIFPDEEIRKYIFVMLLTNCSTYFVTQDFLL